MYSGEAGIQKLASNFAKNDQVLQMLGGDETVKAVLKE